MPLHREGLLAAAQWTRVESGEEYGYKRRVRVEAHGALVQLEGNARPYFSLTYEVLKTWRANDRMIAGGAAHDEILQRWPHLRPLADVHLADDHGVPMHAEANTRYWAGLTEYAPTDDYGRTTLETDDAGTWAPERLRRHLRVDIGEAREIRAALIAGRTWADVLQAHDLAARWQADADTARALLREVTR